MMLNRYVFVVLFFIASFVSICVKCFSYELGSGGGGGSSSRESYNFKCLENPIQQNIENADVILVGGVRQIERNHSNGMFDSLVQIHRIIKGHHLIYELLSLNYESARRDEPNHRNHPHLVKKLSQVNVTQRERRSINKFTINGQHLTVHNMGNKKICDASAKPNDVRIFLLGYDAATRHLVLNSSLIKAELNKMINLNAFIENENYDEVKCNLFDIQI